jgi:aspartate-semialdehyde dehydrogenase
MRICILGATGLVGRELLELAPRAWPGAELALFASRDQALEHGGRRYEVEAACALEAEQAAPGELAFVALDDAHSARYVPRLLALGYRVIDKSNTYRLDPAVPLVVAGVNDAAVAGARLVANPNCTTIPLALALAPLHRRFGVEEVTVSTYQAISGAGLAPLDEFLQASAAGYVASDRLGAAFDPAAYAGNTVPHSGGTDDSGLSAEERKLIVETRKILGAAALPIAAQCARVPVAVGHYEHVWLTLGAGALGLTAAEVEAILRGAAFVRLSAGASGAGLSARACVEHRDEALVGRLRADPRDVGGRRWCLTVAADNLRMGAATNAVRVASRWFPSRDPALRGPGASI